MSLDESGFYNQNDNTFDGTYVSHVVTCLIITIEVYTVCFNASAESASGQIPHCSPYLLMINLRA